MTSPTSSSPWASSRLVGVGLWALFRLINWRSVEFVVTTDRVIYRSGVFAKRGIEIPLARVNNVNFSQGILERIVGAGNLMIESGGEQGQSHFTDVHEPQKVQRIIHEQIEAYRHRPRGGYVESTPMPPPPPASAPAPARPTPAARCRPTSWRSWSPCCSGAPSPRRSSRTRSASCWVVDTRPPASGLRVVSLVPSVTESLLAWGVRPVAVTRFCEQPALRAVGGTKDPDVAAIVDLAPDLVVVNDEENRREDADALAAAGLRVHVTHVESVADVDPTLDALAAAVGAAAAAGRARRRSGESPANRRTSAVAPGDGCSSPSGGGRG